MLKAGSLDRRVTIRRLGAGVNELNEPVGAWADLATVWASYSPVSDGERMKAGEISADKMARFQIRYSSQVASIDPRDRLFFDGAEWEIVGVKEISRRVGLEITAVARAERV